MKDWFQVSDLGWKRVNAGRKMGHLIREAVSNCLDLDQVKNINVTIKPNYLKIEDDSEEGFQDPSLIYTIFMTDKEDSHLKRGRKGRGLKELISAATEATVQTVGKTVIFDQMGRREIDNEKTTGTTIEIHSDEEEWKNPQEAIDYLNKIIVPTGIRLEINGTKVKNPKAVKVIETDSYFDKIRLDTTVIINGIEKIKNEETSIVLYELRENEKYGWIHEMGIPIQIIDVPLHIDIAQRVPMNDNRDVVDINYLKKVYQKVLESMINEMKVEELTSRWVAMALDGCEWNLQFKYKEKFQRNRKILRKSDNARANDIAAMHGYELIEIDAMDPSVKTALELLGTAETYMAEASKVDSVYGIPPENDVQRRFKEITEFIATKIMSKRVTVWFMKHPDYDGVRKIANYQPSTATINFNLLCDTDFNKPVSEEILGILVHELAHDRVSCHNTQFLDEIEKIAGKMAMFFIQNPNILDETFGPIKKNKGKTEFISCVDCGDKREVKTQDLHLVKRCKQCQSEYRKKRAKERRKNGKQPSH